MILASMAHLGLKVRVTNVGAHKIDGSSLATYNMVITVFQAVDRLVRSLYFQETFLPADISIEVVLGMLFFTLGNFDIQFAEKKLIWKTYTTKEALLITRQVEIIDQKEFARVVLNKNIEVFVVHVSSLGSKITIHLAKEAQLALLLAKKVTVLAKYLDFANVFLEESANILPEQIGANEHTIKLQEGK